MKGCLTIILVWVVCIIGALVPPLGILFIILAIPWAFSKKANKEADDYYRRRRHYFRKHYGL